MKGKRITFYDLQPLSLKHEPKMPRRVLEYMLQISDAQLEALLNAAGKVVVNACTFLLVRNPLAYDLHKWHEPQRSWPTWKSDSCLEMCWNRTSFCILLEQFWKTFVIYLHTKDLLLHRSRHDFALFSWIYHIVNYSPAIFWKGKENKVNREDIRGLYLYMCVCLRERRRMV